MFKKMKTFKLNFLVLVNILLLQSSLLAQIPLSIEAYDTRIKGCILDSAQYLFKYKLSFVSDTLKKDTLINELDLLVGNNYSKFFDDLYLREKFINKYNKLPMGIRQNKDGEGLAATEIYKNNVRKIMTVTVMVRSNPYIYEEKLRNQIWTIGRDKKWKNGYMCQKATTTYLGRKYTAWFTPDIPFSNGPWKFGGLPGLILQVYDSKMQYYFDCIGIQQLKQKIPIVKYNDHYSKTKRKLLNNIIRNLHIHFVQTIQSMLAPNSSIMFDYSGYDEPITISNSTNSNLLNISFPYNPIELE